MWTDVHSDWALSIRFMWIFLPSSGNVKSLKAFKQGSDQIIFLKINWLLWGQLVEENKVDFRGWSRKLLHGLVERCASCDFTIGTRG